MSKKLNIRLQLPVNSSHTKRSSPTFYPRNYSVNSLEYIWKSSIPDSWFKIMTDRNIAQIQIHKSNRKTLDFLQETQKYINNICKPQNPQTSFSVPHNSKLSPNPPRFASQNQSPLLKREFHPVKNSFMRKRRKFQTSVKNPSNKSENVLFLPSIHHIAKSSSVGTLSVNLATSRLSEHL
jgi:hypothetical protein